MDRLQSIFRLLEQPVRFPPIADLDSRGICWSVMLNTTFFVPLSIATLLAAQADGASVSLSSQFTEFTGCEIVADGMEEEGNDWIAHECEGFDRISIWLSYADSARSYLGFGHRENKSGPFAIDRDPTWPVEWRGVEYEGSFQPFAVIVRMRRPEVDFSDDRVSQLFVFRLREDGLSCIVGSDIASNAEARDIADGSRNGYECLVEPSVPNNR